MIILDAPIGVMDSGVGGLSVVCELRHTLPNEDIIYYGDTANCPYGNKTTEELLALSGHMLSFMQEKDVKCVALACNTTSLLADRLRPRFPFEIITVAECAADAIVRMNLKKVGLLATCFTVQGGIYERRIHAADPTVAVVSEGSPNLAAMVERGTTPARELDGEIREHMDKLTAAGAQDVILGCTHYPLVLERFRALYPNLRFIDPAPHQAHSVQEFLLSRNALRESHRPSLTVCTTGETAAFEKFCEQARLAETYDISFRKI